jgi:hypothetical protein
MTQISDNLRIDGITILRLENDLLRVDVAPEVGGKIGMSSCGATRRFGWSGCHPTPSSTRTSTAASTI